MPLLRRKQISRPKAVWNHYFNDYNANTRMWTDHFTCVVFLARIKEARQRAFNPGTIYRLSKHQRRDLLGKRSQYQNSSENWRNMETDSKDNGDRCKCFEVITDVNATAITTANYYLLLLLCLLQTKFIFSP